MDNQNLAFKFLRLTAPQIAIHDPLLTQRLEDASGITSFLQLPSPSRNEVFLGEHFSYYIRVINQADFALSNVSVKCEYQTERHKVMLSDSSKTLPQLASGGTHDFNVTVDVKEYEHALTCSVQYASPDGVLRSEQSTIVFASTNPLSVHTKIKSFGGHTFLEVGLGNTSSTTALVLECVKLEAPPGATAHQVGESAAPVASSPTEDAAALLQRRIDQMQLLGPGAVQNMLFELDFATPADHNKADLGRLEIRWKRACGEPGRLQTQHITSTGVGQPSVALSLVEAPSEGVTLDHPFTAALRLTNGTDHRLGPLQVAVGELPAGGAFMPAGPQAVAFQDVPPHSSATVSVTLVPTLGGVQSLTGLSALDATGRIVASLRPTSIFVSS
mmetsp:Transcript_3812/g.10967  ORF Transcript_3812/g.10967 Transcript_3812/m.10967 type:complete len:387 (+) Transcript_3812:335-1495(+)